VQDGLVLMLAIQLRGDGVIECERVPREPALGQERCGDALECPPPVGPRRQVQGRAERASDQSGRLRKDEIAHVAVAQVELDACLGRARSEKASCQLIGHEDGSAPLMRPSRRAGPHRRG
jgi:hypothetical protein